MAILHDPEMKQVIDLVADVAKTAYELITNSDSSGDPDKMPWDERLYEDLLEYAIYLSCADGFISNEEAEAIEFYLEYTISPLNISMRAQKENLYGEDFEAKIPSTLLRFVSMENALNNAGVADQLGNTRMTLQLFSLYVKLGNVITNCDGRCTPTQADKMISYLNKILTYINEECETVNNKNEEYQDKNGISGGVRAPFWKGSTENKVVSERKIIDKVVNEKKTVKKQPVPEKKKDIDIRAVALKLRKVVGGFYDATEEMDKAMNIVKAMGMEEGSQLGDVMTSDIELILVYLASLVGNYSEEIADFISDVCDTYMAPSLIKKYSNDDELIPSNFEEKIPKILMIFIVAEVYLKKNGVFNEDLDIASVFCKLMEDMLPLYVEVLGGDAKLKRAANNIIKNYKNAVENGLSIADSFDDSVKAPVKDAVNKYASDESVKAPKKK